jgi:hypothetical protein
MAHFRHDANPIRGALSFAYYTGMGIEDVEALTGGDVLLENLRRAEPPAATS